MKERYRRNKQIQDNIQLTHKKSIKRVNNLTFHKRENVDFNEGIRNPDLHSHQWSNLSIYVTHMNRLQG